MTVQPSNAPPRGDNAVPADFVTFLSLIHPGEMSEGFIEVRLIRGREVKRRFFKNVDAVCKELDLIRRFNSAGFNVFVGIGRRRSEGGGKKTDIACTSCLFIDFDVANGNTKTEDEIVLELCHRLPIHPSLTNFSGHGIHLYFMLDKPWVFRSEGDIHKFELLQRRLAALAQSDASVVDASRVMRCPGTKNVKDLDHPIWSRILDAHPERCFSLDEFDLFTAHAKLPVSTCVEKAAAISNFTPATAIPPKFYRVLQKSPSLREIWEGRKYSNKSRSERDCSLACSALKHGFSRDEVWAILTEFPYGRGAEASRDYLERTISKAARFVGR